MPVDRHQSEVCIGIRVHESLSLLVMIRLHGCWFAWKPVGWVESAVWAACVNSQTVKKKKKKSFTGWEIDPKLDDWLISGGQSLLLLIGFSTEASSKVPNVGMVLLHLVAELGGSFFFTSSLVFYLKMAAMASQLICLQFLHFRVFLFCTLCSSALDKQVYS